MKPDIVALGQDGFPRFDADDKALFHSAELRTPEVRFRAVFLSPRLISLLISLMAMGKEQTRPRRP
jgi:hypothetical protein